MTVISKPTLLKFSSAVIMKREFDYANIIFALSRFSFSVVCFDYSDTKTKRISESLLLRHSFVCYC